MLEVKNLIKRYGNFTVLKGINFTIEKGSVFGFLGPNGAGKSTTMNILTGLIDYEEGQIFLDGQDFGKNKETLRLRIGYLPENPIYYPYMNAYEYLWMIGDLSGYPVNQIKKRIDELLKLVGLKDAARRRVGGYSRGMKQRLGLAVALFNHPDYLFLDEPTSALDPEGRLEMLKLMEELKELKITVFLSTHILADVERVCDKVSILHKGEIKLTETMVDLRKKFIQPIFDLEMEGNLEEIKDELKRLEWVEEVHIDESKIAVYVTDLEIGKKELPQVIGRLKMPLISYKIRQTTLEDIFIRMVKRDENF
ncbi:multidrug ABC transporter ATP-binding protein [Anoxybacter fermentans]|uniref:Multidrug ABC transporter ATP-binding protein n=1 Tax=Anoxybacter fermentans TaxID=1323375 RepID=A0A3Q9HNV8_9FIRM|nr:ABC transporter ATP-binding protein [Anoxybacter fermentans]AZR72103.1 multidrug ABC transporter ATP-binding protein [Anoxybacter fermentans]